MNISIPFDYEIKNHTKNSMYVLSKILYKTLLVLLVNSINTTFIEKLFLQEDFLLLLFYIWFFVVLYGVVHSKIPRKHSPEEKKNCKKFLKRKFSLCKSKLQLF